MKTMTKSLHARVERMLATGTRHVYIAERLGLNRQQVAKVAQGKYLFGKTDSAKRAANVLGKHDKGGGYTPSPAEIAEACRRLRMARPDDEPADGWVPPGVERPLIAVEL